MLMSMPLLLLRSSSASGSIVVERYGSWAGRQASGGNGEEGPAGETQYEARSAGGHWTSSTSN